jgi:hypothetical protein
VSGEQEAVSRRRNKKPEVYPLALLFYFFLREGAGRAAGRAAGLAGLAGLADGRCILSNELVF